MLTLHKGSLFSIEAHGYVNTVNCSGVVGSRGVFMGFKRRFPEMITAYQRLCNAGELQPGQIWTWYSPTGIAVLNLAIKEHWRGSSQYQWVQKCLTSLKLALTGMRGKKVVMPALGCDRDGLRWNQVHDMIFSTLGDVNDVDIIVLEPDHV